MRRQWNLVMSVVMSAVGYWGVMGRSASSAPFPVSGTPAPPENDPVVAERLLHAFGLHELRGIALPKREPPQYMLQLYNQTTLADTGVTYAANPYQANLIRSFANKVRRKRIRPNTHWSKDVALHRLQFYFNVTRASDDETLLEAEFHLYKLRSRWSKRSDIKDTNDNLLEARVYQIMPNGSQFNDEGHRLLDARRISVDSIGWEMFHVREAAADWLNDPKSNLGLMLVVRNARGKEVSASTFRYEKRRNRIGTNKTPILVLFSHDGRTKPNDTPQPYPGEQDNLIPQHNLTRPSAKLPQTPGSRVARAAPNLVQRPPPNGIGNRNQLPTGAYLENVSYQPASSGQGSDTSQCARYELYVDFEKIGWSSWIISPKGYNAYHCKGQCLFPLGQNQWPTNHATVQSIVNELSLSPGVQKPCCVPNKLYSINLLYFDESENVILKQYDDMVAASCGCH